ncbi:MAG: hypothetical protein IJL48_06985 [Bacteroidales bacterium]|nr:hypothetical protein [Bacteroidales bacterium]
MKNIFSKFVLVAFLFAALSGTSYAEDCKVCKKNSSHKSAVQSKAAVCKRAQSTAELNVNNVRALINGYGNMWYDGSVAQYHLPKNSNTCPLFCAALWIGGTDVNDQLRIAALRFGSGGDDYWPGPLELKTASVDLPVCNYFDKHYIITKNEVLAFMSMFDYSDAGATPNDTYSPDAIPATIKNWPASGINANQSPYLAPFFDANHNGVYEWEEGDYPYYDFNNALCPRTLKAQWGRDYTSHVATTLETEANIVTGGLLSDQVLKGDQTIWWVFNDMGNVHTESLGQPIGMEIRAQAFAFSTNDEINNMTFYTYEIINRSTYELRETYFSQWVDADLGYAFDDYVGCDVKRGLGYCYNGDEVDGPGSGSYTGIPPAVGIDFFQGPYMDPDGKDNPKIDIAKMRAYYPKQLEHYLLPDGTYDTISLTDDADLYYPNAWYFVPGDDIGNCAINGVNFGNNIVDDERFGMRRFVYYDNSSNAISGEPSKATDYYNYLRGYWKNGQRMKYGGNGISTGTTDFDCDFMFPGDSDPLFWGTNGNAVDNWTEVTAGNSPGDRRFMQSAGPFTLKPGALNYITVGIPFAQAPSGKAFSSVELLREIDDVCQALFENCFKVLDGPDAPTLVAQEMNNEVILYVKYDNPASNNFGEKYSEVDPAIVRSYTDAEGNTQFYSDEQRSYKFEGYQIYQLKDANVSIADIRDITKAALVAQCDVRNFYDSIESVTYDSVNRVYDTVFNDNPSLPIGTLVNYTRNSTTGLMTPTIMVEGANQGIKHVFRITTDAFATGRNTNLVNNKEYYFVCVAYAQNRYKEFAIEADKLDGQKEPYLAGRKDEFGRTITPVVAIPHNPSSENGGTVVNAEFGMCPNITRIEGYGNGGSILRLTNESIEELMGAPGKPGKPAGKFRADGAGMLKDPCQILNPRYEQNNGPIRVEVIDPLNVKAGKYLIKFDQNDNIVDGNWTISKSPDDPTYAENPYLYDEVMSVKSDFKIGRYNEQLFLDLGIAVALSNPQEVASPLVITTQSSENFLSRYWGGFVNDKALLSSSVTYADNATPWLAAIPDDDNYWVENWVRSGTQFAAGTRNTFTATTGEISYSENYIDEDYFKSMQTNMNGNPSHLGVDRYQVFEEVAGSWAPYGLVSTLPMHPGFGLRYYVADDHILDSLCRISTVFARTYNKWTITRKAMDNFRNKSLNFNDLSKLPSVQIVFTSDTSKWTRCPVLEMCDDHTQSEGHARRFQIRRHASVDKLGRTAAEAGVTPDAEDLNNPAFIHETGMGWFPGYAINTSTGERLNIMFGEDSRYIQYNGTDMLWNPTFDLTEGTQNYVMGGRHFIYVLNSTDQIFYDIVNNKNSVVTSYKTPSYDYGRWAYSMLSSLERLMDFVPESDVDRLRCNHGILDGESTTLIPQRDSAALLFASVAWVNMPLVSPRFQFKNPVDIPCDVTINLDVNTPYGRYLSPNGSSVRLFDADVQNSNYPMYMFELTSDIATITGNATADKSTKSYKDSILSLINVVPNPYYSYSTYETTSQLETKVRFVNVPVGTVVSIYTIDGTLVRRLGPTSGTATTLDWDLHNHTGIPIAGGVYLIHFKVPGIGDRVVKWFGTMRPVDLNSFGF